MALSPSRVAFRHLTRKQAGGCGFSVYVPVPDAQKAFREAVEDARHERGHGGYSGTIAEKDGFTIRSRTPMSRSEANAFVARDEDRNDKWGPAYAVPVAASKVIGEKQYTVKVKAKNRDEAVRLATEAIKAKGRERAGTTVEVNIPYNGVKLLAAGGTPPVDTTALTATYFTVNDRGNFKDKKAAVLWIKAQLTGSDEYGRRPGTKYVIKQVKEVAVMVVSGEATKVPVFEVTGTRKQVQVGKTEGWLFYGIASC